MTQMLVLETTNNPGTAATVQLAGAPNGFRTWLTALGAGVRDAYVMRDSSGLYEWGVGYATAASPNTFTRETVLGGSSGAGVRVNFTGAVDVYSDFLPELVGEEKRSSSWAGNTGVTGSADLFSITLPARTRSILIVGRARTWGNGGSSLREAIFTAAVRNAADTDNAVVLDIGKAHLQPSAYAAVPIVAHFDFGTALPEARAVRFRAASSTSETVQLYDYLAAITCTKG